MSHTKTIEGAAIAAVRAAARVCTAVQATLVTADTLAKKDKSPVTVADFASQAVVCAMLAEATPDVPVIGEESAGELEGDSMSAMRKSVRDHVAAGLQRDVTERDVLDWINRGTAPHPGATGRFWTLDPIDGTKGFLRKEQYAVALALVENGRVVLGVLACPNYQRGILVTANLGGGAEQSLLTSDDRAPLRVSVFASSSLRFCESVESAHSDQSTAARIAEKLGITAPPLRMDSQVKYAAVARGDAQIYLRLPIAGYIENIWDHAAGAIIVAEAGGRVTDMDGKPLDFSRGRKLDHNRGIIATRGADHSAVLAAVRESV